MTTNPDGTQKLVSYDGCGCAGGAVTTVRDEAGRRKRYTDDFLGRMVKVEELDWNQNVYSTTVNTYNQRDQLTEIRQNAGATTSDPNARIRSFLYDGHGRLLTKTTPEQGATSYQYRENDSLQQTTDARGVVTSLNYFGGTDVVQGITRTAPAGIQSVPVTTFLYDRAGNLLRWVEAGQGTNAFEYDELSRPTTETRVIDGVGGFQMSYDYWGTSGNLKSVTNPYGSKVNYEYDGIGRLNKMTGSGAVAAANYITGTEYRAFGAPKQVTYGNTPQLSLQYSPHRLFLTRWDMPNPAGANTPQTALGYEYNYTLLGEQATGRPNFADNRYDATLDRSWFYDAVGRLDKAYRGGEANSRWNEVNGPYAQGFGYDEFGNVNYRYGWGGENSNYSA